jgi:purine-nucleoside phosphorylase
MMELYGQVQEVVAAVHARWQATPRVGIILGTGLGSLAQQITDAVTFDYEELPHFPRSTAISHAGRLVCGTLQGIPVMAMEGRFHMYEGYSLKQITLPVRVMKAMGADLLVVSNACGGMNPYYRCGDLMVIDDHINLLGDNPLIGINDERLGPRFPDMCEPYDQQLIQDALEVAREQNLVLHRGVFVAVPGPNLETRAEYRFLRMIGADVVGMSTVPEVIVAVHSGMRVIGLSIITDLCFPDSLKPAQVEEIIAHANAAEPRLRILVLGVLARESTRRRKDRSE